MSQYNGELYRDTAAGRAVGWGKGHNTVGCIMTGAEVWLGKLRHDTNFVSWLGGWNDWVLCRNTRGCIVTGKG